MSESRRKFLTLMTGAIAGVGATLASLPFVRSWNPPKHIERQTWDVKFPKLKPGQMMIAVVEQKPIYITRRTPEQIEALVKANPDLRDPHSEESDQPEATKNYHRSIKPEYFVAVGLCTHLGCAPSHVKDDPEYLPENYAGGYFCPCHGAVYDAAGRVHKRMPAPRNLEIPEYEYLDEHSIRIARKL